MLIQYRKKERSGERDIHLGVGKDAVPIVVCLILAVLTLILIKLGVSPSDVWKLVDHLQ
jgi:hypothetical protein